MKVWIWETDQPVPMTPGLKQMIDEYVKSLGCQPTGQHLIGPFVVEFSQTDRGYIQ